MYLYRPALEDVYLDGVSQRVGLKMNMDKIKIKNVIRIGRPCKMTACHKWECYRAWANASMYQDVETSALEKEYNFASRSFKRVIVGVKSGVREQELKLKELVRNCFDFLRELVHSGHLPRLSKGIFVSHPYHHCT
ncbi:unnamed protein product [Euphydryas editha]|uniref:Uncharacterized protein n=1 Tax=Euphydryas editha TaxID=104508 RepID=A0AAU9TGY1_EUPED|nr:unnamed protein product [Euphydryas editha]